jgi:DNA-binding protein H-NS
MIRTGHRGVVGETAGSLMGRRQVDLQTAAQLLGLSADAVRKRAKRGNMDYETGADGKLYVWVDDRETTDYPTGDCAHQPESDPRHGRDELVEELRERVLYLERQVEEERDARRRADRLLARLIERVPELQAPREARESPKSAVEAADTTKPRSATERPQEPSSRPQEDDEEEGRSWWRRLFE